MASRLRLRKYLTAWMCSLLSIGSLLAPCLYAAESNRTQSNRTATTAEQQPDGDVANGRLLKPKARKRLRGPLPEAPLPEGLLSSLAEGHRDSDAGLQPVQLGPPSFGNIIVPLKDNGSQAPPNASVAIGRDHVVVMSQEEVSYLTRAGAKVPGPDGNPLPPLTLKQFCLMHLPTPEISNSTIITPRVHYDRMRDRWIFTAVANPNQSTSAVLMGVSGSGDPTKEWTIFREPVGASLWADFPYLGLNQKWIVVAVSCFVVIGSGDGGGPVVGPPSEGRFYVFGKDAAYTGTKAMTVLKYFTSNFNFNPTIVPAVDYDNTSQDLYMIQDSGGQSGDLRLWSISGQVGQETLSGLSRTGPVKRFWVSFPPIGVVNFLPQKGGSPTGSVATMDSRIRTVVVRNGSIWCVHSVFLQNLDRKLRTALQWWQINFQGQVQKQGLIGADNAATGMEAGVFYDYPSMAVNRNNDILIGYSHFTADTFPSAGHSYRAGTDPNDPNDPLKGLMREPRIIPKGNFFYNRTDAIGRNRWGDISTTIVDPVNDETLWTCTQFATVDGNQSRWALVLLAIKVVTSVNAASFNGSAPVAPDSIVAGFGDNLATGTFVGDDTDPITPGIQLPTSLGGTTLRVTDSAGVNRPAPLFFVSPGQINYLVPPGTSPGTASVTVTSGSGERTAAIAAIAQLAPGLFTANSNGTGVPSANILRISANGSQSFEPVAQFDPTLNRYVPFPIDMGPPTDQVFLILYGTGIRPNASQSTSATIGGVPVTVMYAGSQGGYAGLDQVNLLLPRSLIGRGDVDVILTVAGLTANTVMVKFQ